MAQHERGPSVKELQAMATAAVRPRRRGRLSRAARLMLIDWTSRNATMALATLAGLTVCVASFACRTEPFRAALWTLTVGAPLIVARNLVSGFRSGQAIAARPFTWRGQYAAALAVAGAAFGAGALICVDENSPPDLALLTLTLLMSGGLVAALLQSASARCAAAIWAPVSAFCVIGAWRAEGLWFAIFGAAAAAVAGGCALFLVGRVVTRKAARQFPRAGAARRTLQIDTPDAGGHLDAVAR